MIKLNTYTIFISIFPNYQISLFYKIYDFDKIVDLLKIIIFRLIFPFKA